MNRVTAMIKTLFKIFKAIVKAFQFECRYCGGAEYYFTGYYDEVRRCRKCGKKG